MTNFDGPGFKNQIKDGDTLNEPLVGLVERGIKADKIFITQSEADSLAQEGLFTAGASQSRVSTVSGTVVLAVIQAF